MTVVSSFLASFIDFLHLCSRTPGKCLVLYNPVANWQLYFSPPQLIIFLFYDGLVVIIDMYPDAPIMASFSHLQHFLVLTSCRFFFMPLYGAISTSMLLHVDLSQGAQILQPR